MGNFLYNQRKGARLGIKADVPMMRVFVREHGLNAEILDDGSIKGKAAYDVAAFRILMSKSAGNTEFYHEVFENMLAISPKLFERLENLMKEHYLKTHSLSEYEEQIATYMTRYETDDYALGRKEWVCSYAAKQLDTEEGRQAFFDWLHSHDKTHTLGQRILDFFRRIGRAIKRAMNGDWIGTAQKRKGAKLSAEIEGIIALLEENRVYQASLKDGQKITLGGKKTMRWARTFFESGVGTPEMVDPLRLRYWRRARVAESRRRLTILLN